MHLMNYTKTVKFGFKESLDKGIVRDGSRAAATSRMECFVVIVNGWKPLAIITKHSILDVAVALAPPLIVRPSTFS